MHPTQTLADLATITVRRGEIKNLRVGLCGDLKYGRTVHSIVYALSKFPGIRFTLISPKGLSMPESVVEYMRANNITYDITENLESSIPELDILYMTRVQKERFSDPAEFGRYSGVYVLNREKLNSAKADLLVMHPLPRVDEITPDVDDDPRAAYFDQVKYGMYIRMALLTELLG
jgi:aspartate carbamoyltransferase catalytic subunit